MLVVFVHEVDEAVLLGQPSGEWRVLIFVEVDRLRVREPRVTLGVYFLLH